MTSCWFIIFVIFSVLLGYSFYYIPLVSVIVMLTIIIGLFLNRLLKNDSNRKIVMGIFILSILIRFFISGGHNVLASHNGIGDMQGDAMGYISHGVYISEILTGRTTENISSKLRSWVSDHYKIYKQTIPHYSSYQITGMSYLQGVLYSAFGFSPLSIKLLNSLLSVLSGVIIYFFLRKRVGNGVAVVSYVLTVFYPSLLLWSVTGLKESIILFATIIALILWGVFLNGEMTKRNVLFVALIFLILFNLMPMFKLKIIDLFYIVLSFSSLLTVVGKILSQKNILLFKGLLVSLIFFLVLFSFSHRDIIQGKMHSFYSGAIHRSWSGRIGASSAYNIYPDRFKDGFYRDPLKSDEMFISSIKAIAYFLFAPFSWDLHLNRSLVFLFPQSILTLLLFPFLIIGMIWTFRYKPYLFMPAALFLIGYVFVTSLHFSNIGTSSRFKDLIMPLYLMFSVIGLYKIFNPKLLNKQR